MHIPDNFLSTPVWATLDAIALPSVAIISRKAQASTDTNRLPLLGVMGAFVFAAQMINFPVGLGTSGHLVGGTLLACLLGPWAASLVLTAILLVQAFVFQDGGVLALGANILNMALVGVWAGYLPYAWLQKRNHRLAGVVLGGICSVMSSGILALSELAISGIRMPTALVAASLFLFLINAIGEGAITVTVLRAIQQRQPLSRTSELSPAFTRRKLAAGLGVASIVIAAGGILIASSLPDGLENLAARLGLAETASLMRSPLSEYQVQMLGSSWFSRASAGLAGLLIIYLLCSAGALLLGKMRRSYSS